VEQTRKRYPPSFKGKVALEAIYPKPHLSIPGKHHKVYPYLLRGLGITHPDQVWAADITYIRLHRGWLYLVAIIDWFSRYVLSWETSITMEADFCLAALQKAFISGFPGIFNTDQGAQFTSGSFTDMLQEKEINISNGVHLGPPYSPLFVNIGL
jgi:putative transposase